VTAAGTPVEVPDPLCLSVRDACRELGGLGRSTLYELLAKGEIDSMRVGARRLVVTASLRAFVERQLAAGQS